MNVMRKCFLLFPREGKTSDSSNNKYLNIYMRNILKFPSHNDNKK